MKEQKYHIYLTEQERSEVIKSLIDLKNTLIRQGKYTDAVDDVLVNFDDRRAGAAFAAFAELAAETQVIVLTHHPHLVEVARERLGEHRVAVTELGDFVEALRRVVQG